MRAMFHAGNLVLYEKQGIPVQVETYIDALGDEYNIPNGNEPIWEVPNIVEFVFAPSASLPPGRYYLTVNTTNERGNPTVDGSVPNQIHFVTKYVTEPGEAAGSMTIRNDPGTVDPCQIPQMIDYGTTSIVEDVMSVFDSYRADIDPAAPLDDTDGFYDGDYWKHYWLRDESVGGFADPLPEAVVGAERAPWINPDAANPPSGWVMLPALNQDQFVNIDPARLPSTSGYAQNDAFTVTIPPFRGRDETSLPPVYLHVAVCMGEGAPADGAFCINFFDFSQEPDHEWVRD